MLIFLGSSLTKEKNGERFRKNGFATLKESKTRAADRCFTRLRHVESLKREALKRREPAFGRRGDLRRGRPGFVPQLREYGVAGRECRRSKNAGSGSILKQKRTKTAKNAFASSA